MGKKKEQSTPIPVTHVIIILDRSGSMEACRAETISGFNEQVQKICATTKSEGLSESTYVTLVLFNQEVTRSLRICVVNILENGIWIVLKLFGNIFQIVD